MTAREMLERLEELVTDMCDQADKLASPEDGRRVPKWVEVVATDIAETGEQILADIERWRLLDHDAKAA